MAARTRPEHLLLGRFRPGARRAGSGYDAAVRRAFATVPYYRDHWARAGRAVAPQLLRPAEVDAAGEWLTPWAVPGPSEPEPLAALEHALALLGLAGAEVVFRLRGNLDDTTRVGCAGYVAVLTDLAHAAPATRVRQERVRARLAAAGTTAAVIATIAELALVETGTATRIEVHDLADRPAASGPAALLHERHLGLLGVRIGDCRGWHVDPARFDVRDVDDAIAVTGLLPGRPTLVNYVPDPDRSWTLGACGSHATPILDRVDHATA